VLTHGSTQRQKTVTVQGMAWREALQRLREGLDTQR
jgi:hypothetical protein